MKVEIVKFDGSFGPVTIVMTAETDEDRKTLSLMNKISFSTSFRIESLSGNAETESVDKLTLQEHEDDPMESS